MVDIVNKGIDRYLNELVKSTDPILLEMEALAEDLKFPIIGPQVGHLIRTVAIAAGARKVLELGSGFGYSAFFFSQAVGSEGKVILTEYDEQNGARAREFLTRAGFCDRVDVKVGDGLESARTLAEACCGVDGSTEGPFDIVFNDIEKAEYPKALDIARSLLRPGGLFICDNMLWYGRVLEPSPKDLETAGIIELTRRLVEAKDFDTTFIPMRDGVTISVRVN